MPRRLIWEDASHKASIFDDAAVALPNAPAIGSQTFAAAAPPNTPGPDVFNGTANRDVISGGEGGDTINGAGGDDVLYGFGPQDRTVGGGRIDATLVASGLDNPVFAQSAPGDPNRLFIVEQHTGQIKILDLGSGQVLATPFLDIDGLATGGEQGVLGMAFHPNYENNGKYYVFTNRASDGDIEVWQYTRGSNPDVSNTTRKLIIRIDHSAADNHNGGWMSFGPDGYLYIAVGDGGGGGDPENDAQNINSLLGKILRIDVNGDDFASTAKNYAIPDDNPFVGKAGADEVFAIGLRNPWRNGFDTATGDLYIADVGQGAWEEINYVPAGGLNGANFGWHVLEGTHIFDDGTPGNPDPNDPNLWTPVYEYGHNDGPFGGFAVTGGYVVHNADPGGQGLYIFADFVTGNIWSMRAGEDTLTDLVRRNPQIVADAGSVDSIASFGLDGNGNLYVVGLDGEIHRLTFNVGAGDAGDNLNGGPGNDKLFGGVGDDTLNGGADVDALRGGDGDDVLIGGAGGDNLSGGAGTDTASYIGATAGVTVNLATGSGSGSDAQGDKLSKIENLIGSNSADALTGNGGANLLQGRGGGDTLRGAGGDDGLSGGAGADDLSGGSGADALDGGLGKDHLTGGAGDDAFVFSAKLGGPHADTIEDFGDGADMIYLSHVVFTSLGEGALAPGRFVIGAHAGDSSDRIIYNSATGQLFFDPDGTGAKGQVLFATLTDAPTLSAADFLVV